MLTDLSDSDLQRAVQDELAWEPGVSADHIGVTARSGVVTLSGHIESYAGKLAAEAAAGRIKGVKCVVEELSVQLPGEAATDDDAIAVAALERLAWNVIVPSRTVMVKVERGWVTLTGEVSSRHQRDAVESDIRPLKGVTGVSDHITIKSSVDTVYLCDNIAHALHRSWFFDPNEVQVAADGGNIRLTGSVQSYYERSLAETTAWAAPGATSVQNDIAVVIAPHAG